MQYPQLTERESTIDGVVKLLISRIFRGIEEIRCIIAESGQCPIYDSNYMNRWETRIGFEEAAHSIMQSMGASRATIDWVVQKYVEECKRMGMGMFGGAEFDYALRVAMLGASVEIVEWLLALAVSDGSVLDTEEILKIAKRNLAPQEAEQLAVAYISHLYSECDAEERIQTCLFAMLRKVLPAQRISDIKTTIESKIQEFKRYID